MKGKALPIQVIDGGESLYAKQPKIYPREIDGRYQRLRKAAVFWLLGMFYVFPWISIGGQQLVLFDLPARRFHVFGLTFWPQDFYLLTLLLVIAALSLFFFTALAGRLWCGFACPQTVWTEVFLWMERWTEGDRNARIKLDKAPWSRDKLLRKGAKQFLWIGFALWTGFTFVGFFTPVRELGPALIGNDLGAWEAFWIGFYSLATYGNAGLLREQVCKYMCPYARFQSAMFDRDTLIISYDEARGEPRGHRKRGKAGTQDSGLGTRKSGVVTRSTVAVPTISAQIATADAATNPESRVPSPESRLLGLGTRESGVVTRSTVAVPTISAQIATADAATNLPESRVPSPESRPLGDCIDCLACVQVCPTGIDIRDGLQIECIACAACIDACDAVMDKMEYPRGLIRYTTEQQLAGRPRRVLRPRIAIYAAILFAFVAAFAWAVTTRAPVIVEVLHDRNGLFRTVGKGAIENSYNVKLVNKTDAAMRLSIRSDGDLPLTLVGQPATTLEAGEVVSLPLTLRAQAGSVTGRHAITILVSGADGSIVARGRTHFFAPEAKP